jgi:hypothetical protein
MRTGLIFPLAAVGIGGFMLGSTMMLAMPATVNWLQTPVEFLFLVGLHHPVLRTMLAITPALLVFLGPMMFVLTRRRAAETARSFKLGG